MEICLIDTNIASYFIKRHSLASEYRQLIFGRPVAISFMSVAELYEWSSIARWGRGGQGRLRVMLNDMLILFASRATCQLWADIRWRRRQHAIPFADAWIAAAALEHDLELVTHNPSDFVGIPKLKIITDA